LILRRESSFAFLDDRVNHGTHRSGVSRTVVPSPQTREDHVDQPPHARLDRPILEHLARGLPQATERSRPVNAVIPGRQHRAAGGMQACHPCPSRTTICSASGAIGAALMQPALQIGRPRQQVSFPDLIAFGSCPSASSLPSTDLEYLGFLVTALPDPAGSWQFLHGRSRLSATGVIVSLEKGAKYG
jgi:hypothetical protein